MPRYQSAVRFRRSKVPIRRLIFDAAMAVMEATQVHQFFSHRRRKALSISAPVEQQVVEQALGLRRVVPAKGESIAKAGITRTQLDRAHSVGQRLQPRIGRARQDLIFSTLLAARATPISLRCTRRMRRRRGAMGVGTGSGVFLE